jgi:hypothetical protein
MCGALYKNGRTAQAICARWRQSAERYCETEIEKSSEQARNTLARQLDSWQRLLSHVQEAERAIVVKGDKCAPSWSDPIWTRWKPSERKPAGVRLGNYFLRAKLPTGDNASLVVPAILSFPGDRCLLLKIGDTFVAQNQSGPESHASAEADRQQDGARHKRRGRARRIEDIEEDDDDEEEESF